ncbi:response to water-immersion restraint stress [Sparganum proliferum]
MLRKYPQQYPARSLNSIRHNLSLHDKFVKCPKASESAKSSHWRLNSSSPTRSYVRRRACSMETGNMKKAKARAGAVAAFAANARRSVAAQSRKLPNGGVVSSGSNSLLLSAAGGSTTTTGPMDAKSWLNWEPSASIDRLGCTDLSSGSGLLPLVGSSSSSSGGESAFSAPSGLTKQPPRRGPLCQSVAGIGAESSSSLSENALAANLLICQHNSATQQSWYNFAASRRASEELSFASHLRQQQGVSNILSSFDYEKARTFTSDESGQTPRPFHQQHLDAMHAASANRPHTSLTAQIFRQHFANTDFRAPHPLRYPFSCLHHNYEHQSQGSQAQPVAQQPTPPPPQQQQHQPQPQQSNYVTEPRRSLNLIDLQPANPSIAYRESTRCSASPERSGHSVSGMVSTTSPPLPPPPPPLRPAPPPSYSSDLTDVSLEPVSYCLSNIMSDAAGDNIDIPERFLRSNSTDEEMTPIVSASSVVTAVEPPQQASAPPLLANHSSHLHNLLTSSGNGPHSSATSVDPARSCETVLPLSQDQNTNNYIESLELQLSLQVANRVVGSCLSTANPEELGTGDADVCSPKMHWPRTVENGAN